MSASLSGVERSRRVLSNVRGGLLARAGSLALMFYATRLMLQRLGATDLGLWLVVLGVLQWVTFFDFGIAYGARNEIARCLALGDRDGAARAIATAYGYCLRVAAGLGVAAALLMLTPVNGWLTQHVFAGRDLGPVLASCLFAFLVNFVLGFVQQIYAALEKAAAASLYALLVNLLLVAALMLVPAGRGLAIGEVAALYCLAMILPNLALTAFLFTRHPELRPARARFDHGLRGTILGVGLPLFVIQLCALVIFSTDRLIVSAVVGPQAVVAYDAAFKVFSVPSMAHTLVMGVLWSSFTHAYTQRDWDWIRRVLRRLELLMLPLVLGSALLALLAPAIVRLWLGEAALGSTTLYAGFAVFTVLSCWSNIYAHFLNGIGNVRVQMYSALCAAVINIPVSLYFARGLGMGAAGVIWGSVLSLCFFSVIGPLQAAAVIRKEAVLA